MVSQKVDLRYLARNDQALFEHKNVIITDYLEIYWPIRSTQSSLAPRTVILVLEIYLSNKHLTHETANSMHEDILEPDIAILEKLRPQDSRTYFSSSTESSTPNAEAKHRPPTLSSPHPCSHPIASTYPSELHSMVVTGPVGLLYGFGICTV